MTSKEENLTFLYPPAFDKAWRKCGLTSSDKEEMESLLSHFNQQENHIGKPYLGDTIQKTGGAIKLRFSPESSQKGKSGSYRIIYFIALENTYAFLDVYPKSAKESLTDKDKKEIKQFITDFKKITKKGAN
ncbi:type II toxin-antitoxin system RelE/ParE family toxin [Carnobacterium mobile]|uniref:type II toxin-antitoxin system RelE/ParE family toxin n=1 Tax=Carnobacterium mobile TaxID=2750 RepID=UPI00054CDAFF|nr:type II toxin-antitoxin system RelE/ParE family toxin [Carnobacterium mobile]